GGPGEEEERLRVLQGERRSYDVEVRDGGNLVDALAAGRTRASENQLADEPGFLQRDGLGNHAAQGKGENVDLVEAERPDERDGVLGHRFDRVGDRAAGGADAAVVERDHAVLLGDAVDDPRV